MVSRASARGRLGPSPFLSRFLRKLDARRLRHIREPDYGDILRERARGIGPNALAWAERCFALRDFPEQAFATVQGMIRLAEDHDSARVDAICAEALDLRVGRESAPRTACRPPPGNGRLGVCAAGIAGWEDFISTLWIV